MRLLVDTSAMLLTTGSRSDRFVLAGVVISGGILLLVGTDAAVWILAAIGAAVGVTGLATLSNLRSRQVPGGEPGRRWGWGLVLLSAAILMYAGQRLAGSAGWQQFAIESAALVTFWAGVSLAST
jgi:hypothetical protein